MNLQVADYTGSSLATSSEMGTTMQFHLQSCTQTEILLSGYKNKPETTSGTVEALIKVPPPMKAPPRVEKNIIFHSNEGILWAYTCKWQQLQHPSATFTYASACCGCDSSTETTGRVSEGASKTRAKDAVLGLL